MSKKANIKQAVILAAGERKDFDKPAAFLEIDETVIIERLIRILKDNGIDKIIIVTGYKSHYFEKLNTKEVELVYSDRYKWTGSMHSLSLVEEYIDEDFLLINGDLIFEEKAVDYLLQVEKKNCLVLVNESGTGDDKLVETREDRVFRISKDIHQLGKIDGEFIGLSRISLDTYKEMLVDFQYSKNPYLHYEYVLMNIRDKHITHYAKIDDLVWSELDTLEDYKRLKFYVYPQLLRREVEFREKSIGKLFLELMGDNYQIEGNIEKLGGMNNGNYKIFTPTQNYVLRLPGKGSQETVNRDSELFNSKIAYEIGIDSKTVYFDNETGIKIAEYIQDAETLNVTTARREDNMRLMADALNKLHNSGKKFYRDFTPFKEIEEYKNKILKEEESLLDNYQDLEKVLDFLKAEIGKIEIEHVPCHLDAWPENFVKGSDRIYLIDWEYSCNYDRMWDVASIGLECEYSKDEEELYYNKYFNREPSEIEIKKMDLFRILMDIYWSIWSLSEVSIGVTDLYDYSLGRYKRGLSNFNSLKLKLK